VAEGADVSWMVMKALLNHSIKGDVTAIYPHVSPERMRVQVQKVGDRMKLLCGIEDVSGENVKKLKRV